MSNFENSILRVLKGDSVIGAAFLVSDRLVVTCAHVVEAAGAKVGGKISVRLRDGRDIEASVEPEFWRNPNAEDISILRLKEPFESIQPVIFGSSSGTKGHSFSTLGFPKKGQELSGGGEIIGQATIDGVRFLQLDSRQVTPGFSGAPIFDEITKRVVGMVVAITPPDEYQRLGTTAFAIPSEIIREIDPELQISDICPYRSLEVFNEEDAPFFFGRERVVQKVIDSLKRELRFLAVLGPSGSGKSSVVCAGLIPALKQGKVLGSDKWGVIIIRPANQPFEQLHSAGLSQLQEGLESSVRAWLANHVEKKRLILVIDQFEELLVSTPEDIRQKFIKELANLLDSAIAITVILTLRDDFYSRFLQESATLATWLERGLVNIPPVLDEDELGAMIVEPAKAVGLNFEKGLVDVIIGDAVEADRTKERAQSTILPLLEFVLTQLWEKRQDGQLNHNAYHTIGRVTGGLAQWADKAYNTLNKDDRLLARRILTDLIHLGDPSQGLPDSKRRRTISDLPRTSDEQESIYRIIRTLTGMRLLVTGRDNESEIVELIHDALIREWGLLHNWMQSDRDFRVWHEQLHLAVKRWIASSRDEGALLRGVPLVEAESWQEKRNPDIADSEREYLNLSILLREREQREQAHAREMMIAKDWAEKTAIQEQSRRAAAEALVKSSRQLSTLSSVTEVPQQIVAQLSQLVASDRCALFIEDVNGVPRLFAHHGFPDGAAMDELNYHIKGTNVHHIIAKQAEPMLVGDVKNLQGWIQPNWLPEDRSWLGVPVYSKNKVIGMLTLSRKETAAFNQDDVLLASTFALQASIALENARLYDELNRFNQMMERMVEQRVNELNNAYNTLEKLDKNKSDFILVAAHELRTPLTVMNGYLNVMRSFPEVKRNSSLDEVLEGIFKNSDRMNEVVGTMLDVARVDTETLKLTLAPVSLKEVIDDLVLEFRIPADVRSIEIISEHDPETPNIIGDAALIQKALIQLIINAIKYTPDGGKVIVRTRPALIGDKERGVEIAVKDTGIGLDSAHHQLVFEKFYQVGSAEIHSSGITTFKGGGPGLGLAIAAGIVKAHKGRIWVESLGFDQDKFPGCTFFIQLPAK